MYWEVEGFSKVPQIIPIMLQCIRYTRYGAVQQDNLFLISPNIPSDASPGITEMWMITVEYNNVKKQFRIDSKLTINTIVAMATKRFIGETSGSIYRLFDTSDNKWLLEVDTLSSYPNVKLPVIQVL